MMKHVVRGLGAGAFLAFSCPALCQTGAADGAGPTGAQDVIRVTGTRRDTTLQDADVAVTVLGATDIEEARLRDFSRIDDLVPNVQFNESGQTGTIFVTIRGVESNPFIVNRAAVYIDGIPFRELNNAVLNQVQSIEVLRGPQGTLYGANTESGLVVVTTRQPTSDPQASFRLTGTSFSSGTGVELDGFMSGPLAGDNLAGSFAFKRGREDSYVENLGTSTGETGHINDTFLQGRLRWAPNADLTVNATAYYRDMDAPGVFDTEYVPLDLETYNRLYADLYNGGRRAGDHTTFNDAPKYTREEEYVVGVSANYALDYGMIDMALSYRQLDESAAGLDFDMTAAPILAGLEAEYGEYTHAEIRFSSPESERFDYLVGVSFYDEYKERTLATFLGQGDLDSYNYAPTQEATAQDVSVFGSANWSPSVAPDLRLGFGLRYDRAKRGTLQRAGVLDLGYGSQVAYRDADLSETFEALLPRVSLRYTVNDSLSVYASAARGYIPGGFNLTAVQDGYTEADVISYDSETLWSREVGFKWRSRERGLRASGAIFYITSDNWQEIQIATDDSGRPVSSDYIGSNASIRSQGVEFEASWDVTDGLSLDGHVGLVDAEYRDLLIDSQTNVRGRPIQFVPEYDGLLAARYEWPAGFFVRAEASFTGENPLRARGDIVQEAVAVYGLQLGYETDRFGIRVFGENLTDERRASGLAVQNLAFGDDGLFYGPLDAPRIIGVELEANF